VRPRAGREAIGVITIAGPLVRWTTERMLKLGPQLVQAASELGAVGANSPLFRRAGA
jgi:DNA-binding IclR family transcriptional regulator